MGYFDSLKDSLYVLHCFTIKLLSNFFYYRPLVLHINSLLCLHCFAVSIMYKSRVTMINVTLILLKRSRIMPLVYLFVNLLIILLRTHLCCVSILARLISETTLLYTSFIQLLNAATHLGLLRLTVYFTSWP